VVPDKQEAGSYWEDRADIVPGCWMLRGSSSHTTSEYREQKGRYAPGFKAHSPRVVVVHVTCKGLEDV
jgi:hypothetical protein